jgi:hypothetical protein
VKTWIGSCTVRARPDAAFGDTLPDVA